MDTKVLIISGSLPPLACGVGYYTHRLVQEFNNAGKVVSILSTDGLGDDLREKNTLYTTKGWGISQLPKLIVTCRTVKPDVIHIQYPAKGYARDLGINLLPYLLRLFLPKSTLVITLHEYFGSPLLGRLRNLMTILAAQTIIISNQADKQALPRIVRNKARIIPIGSNLQAEAINQAQCDAVMGPGRRFESRSLLFFGFAFPTKQLERLIDAMHTIDDKRLLIACDLNDNNDYHASLLKQISLVNKTGSKIDVIGFQPDEVLLGLLERAFCFVLPQNVAINSKSSTALAAVAAGLPIIGTKGSPVRNHPFEDATNCLLIDPTADNIAKAVNALSHDKALYTKLSQTLTTLSKQYSWTSIGKRHLDLYEQ